MSDRSKFCPNCGTAVADAGVGAAVGVTDAAAATVELAPIVRLGEAVPIRVAAHGGRNERHLNADATFGMRFGALFYDVLLLSIGMMVASFLISGVSRRSILSSNSMLLSFYLVSAALYAANFLLLAAGAGQTLGKRIIGIRIVRIDGRRFGVGSAALRHLVGYALSGIFGMLGFVWATWDPRHQTWHDKLAGTIVIQSR
jgi:uncharacterized RDD family membrane protein YckC